MARQQTHGISRYRKANCRCVICCAANEQLQMRRRRHPERSFKIPAGPLVELMKRQDGSLHGMQARSAKRWLVEGVDVFTADRICVTRGFHPFEVYGTDWYGFGEHDELG